MSLILITNATAWLHSVSGDQKGVGVLMMNMLRRLISPRWRPGSAALAGLLATLAYSIAMEWDKYLIGNQFNDVRFIEGVLEGGEGQSTRRGRLLAWLLHLFNGVALAEIYASTFKRILPGPDWLKGAIFGEAFITGAWLLTPLADKYHPLIKKGEMPKLATWRSFIQNLLRHLIFGLMLGLLYREK
jgi:hypothetical protein